MKKIFFALLILLIASMLNASEYTDTILPGKWNIEGTSFIEKGIIRLSVKIDGEVNQTTEILKNLNASVDKIIENNQEKARNLINEERKVLNGCEVNLRLYIFDKAGFDIKVWDHYIPNAVQIPVLLPEMRPTINKPFVLPSITKDNITYTITFTSETSGKLRAKGYVDVDAVGTCEINADCALWRDGTTKPETEKETKSGCNSLGIFSAFIVLLMMMIGRGTKFCSGQI
ncbi:MAG: hypothetical protein IKN30_00185, partial [Synergistaceae bacterium]|nr:hypothetical protein [Synergistaceae bacterium]